MNNLTSNEALAVGAVFGTLFGFALLFLAVYYILLVVASWKLFIKAGEKGWKSLIPVYNAYILYKISGLSFWKWLVLPAVIMGVFSVMADKFSDYKTVFSLIYIVIQMIIMAKFASKLAKAFGKGTGFAVGLFFFPNIFQLILAFGPAKYIGNDK